MTTNAEKYFEGENTMTRLTVVKVKGDSLTFNDGSILCSEHDSECCETHYLDFSNLTLADFEDLEFDLSGDDFFRRVEDYGIELIPICGWSIKIPGYGVNNGYYSHDLTLELIKDGKIIKSYDIEDCQSVDEY